MVSKNCLWPLDKLEDYPFIRYFKMDTLELGSSWDIFDLSLKFLRKICNKNISSKVKIPPNVIIKGDVTIEEGVKIMEFSKIIGPTYIGKNVIIGNNVLIRESFIGEESVIGFQTDIARSYVGKSCWLSRSHVADSFLDDRVKVGSGTVASLRLDGKDAFTIVKTSGKKRCKETKIKMGVIIGKGTRIGANVVIFPGKKIGRNSIVCPGVLISEDIDDNIFCKTRQEIILYQNRVEPDEKIWDRFKMSLIKTTGR